MRHQERRGPAGGRIHDSHGGGAGTVEKAFVYAIVLFVPVSFMVSAFRGGAALVTFKVPLADAAIGVGVIVLLVKGLWRRTFGGNAIHSAPIVAFAAVSVMSVLGAGIGLDSAKELFQLLLQFVGGYFVLAHGLRSAEHLRSAAILIAIVSCMVIVYGLVQYLIIGENHYLVSSVFDNRNVLGGYCALVLPLLFGLLLDGASTRGVLLYGMVIVAGLLVTTSITSLLGILAAFLFMILFRGRRILLVPTVALFIVVVSVPLGVRVSDFSALKYSHHEPRSLEKYHDNLRKSICMCFYPVIGVVKRGSGGAVVQSSMLTEKAVPETFIERQLVARRKDASYGEGGHLRQRLLEWQAGLNILSDRPLFGVGVGNYQREIGHYYFTAPKLNTMEPDSQSGYLETLFTTGLAGLAAFAWILLRAFRNAARNVNGATDPFIGGLSLGAMGGMIAFSINNMFAPLIYQSTAVQFIILLCVIDASARISSGTGCAPPAEGR